MFLFILESIGTSELLLIGMVALIVFGPRKIPEIARTVGKFMAEFRRSTDDFKRTWEREAGLDENFTEQFNINNLLSGTKQEENLASTDVAVEEKKITVPEIKEINQKDFNSNFNNQALQNTTENKKSPSEKRDWL